MNVVVLADTHAPRRWKGCPARVAEHLRGADVILHAGRLRIFSPGSPTDRRRQPHGTVGLLRIEQGRLVIADIVSVT
jgi:predicted phosphodiesterase